VKHLLLVAFLSLAAACAGVASRPSVDSDAAGSWHGYLLHDGLREPIFVSLDEDDTGWSGTYSEGANSVPLSAVSIADSGRVHFEVQGKVAFDGSVAGRSMAGTVSGPSAGSFALDRQPEWNPYPNGP
jgi:hypothetical protein